MRDEVSRLRHTALQKVRARPAFAQRPWARQRTRAPSRQGSRAIKVQLARPAGLEPATLGLEVRSSGLPPDPPRILRRKEFNKYSVLPRWWGP